MTAARIADEVLARARDWGQEALPLDRTQVRVLRQRMIEVLERVPKGDDGRAREA